MPPGFDFLFLLLAFGVAVYFMMIRPQQKRMREHQETMNSLEPGTRVMLQSGLFGTLTHIGERQAIVELAPGTEVTIVKPAIVKVITADEEEFEFTDEAPEDGPALEELADEDTLVDETLAAGSDEAPSEKS